MKRLIALGGLVALIAGWHGPVQRLAILPAYSEPERGVLRAAKNILVLDVAEGDQAISSILNSGLLAWRQADSQISSGKRRSTRPERHFRKIHIRPNELGFVGRVAPVFDPDMDRKFMGRSLAEVFHFDSKSGQRVKLRHFAILNEDVCAQLLLRRVARDINGCIGSIGGVASLGNSSPGGLQSQRNENYTYASYSRTPYRDQYGPKSPFGLLPLGLKVVLFAPFLPLGIWIGVRSLTALSWRETNAWPYIRCWLAIMCGASIATCGAALIVL